MKNKWTFDDIPELSGKTIIITGGNSSLGFETVRYFSAKGAQPILACRNEQNGKSAKKEIQEEHQKFMDELMMQINVQISP